MELELGKERRTAARDARRASGQSIGRPKALTDEKVARARRIHDSGESATTIATILGVNRATVYRVLSRTRSSRTALTVQLCLVASRCGAGGGLRVRRCHAC